MQVTNVRVSFLREKQPAQYEKAQPFVEFAAVLDENDDHRVVARNLMANAAVIVYAGIGYDMPTKVAEALGKGSLIKGGTVVTETTEVPPEASEAAEETPETEEVKPKTRGRPRGSKNTAPKKETAAAKRKREAAEAKAAEEASGVPGEDEVPGDEPKPNISTGGERVNPEDEVPGDDREEHVEDAEFTPKDLHTLIMSHVNATPRTLSVANAKQVLAHFKVARAQDLSDEQALEGKVLVEKMVAASKET